MAEHDPEEQRLLLTRGGEARRAAGGEVGQRHIRQMRATPAGGGVANLKPWITGANDSGVPQLNGTYAGEDNVTQAGINIPGLGFSVNASTAAFDEPLAKADVLAIASLFIKYDRLVV